MFWQNLHIHFFLMCSYLFYLNFNRQPIENKLLNSTQPELAVQYTNIQKQILKVHYVVLEKNFKLRIWHVQYWWANNANLDIFFP